MLKKTRPVKTGNLYLICTNTNYDYGSGSKVTDRMPILIWKNTCGMHSYNDDSAEGKGTVETNETRATRRYSFKFVDRKMLVKRRFMYE